MVTIRGARQFGPHLPVPGECVSRIGGKLLRPFAQHVLVHIQITSSLRNCDTALANEPHRLKLELAAELPSLHCGPQIG